VCVVGASIVILSSQLLFAEGVAQRLRQQLQHPTLTIVNPGLPNAMAKLLAAQPSVIILDVADPKVQRLYCLSELLLLLPVTRIIRLDPQQNQLQLVISEQHPASEVRDLVEVIEQVI